MSSSQTPRKSNPPQTPPTDSEEMTSSKNTMKWQSLRKKRASNPEDENINKFLSARNTALITSKSERPAHENTSIQHNIRDQCGTLTISLHEAVNLSLPEQYHQILEDYRVNSGKQSDLLASPETPLEGSARPLYALVDVDKSQVLVYVSSGTVQNTLWTNSSSVFDITGSAELIVHIYMRNALSAANSGRSNDVCLGGVRAHFKSNDDNDGIVATDATQSTASDREMTGENWDQKWLELDNGTGEVCLSVTYSENKISHQIQDFETVRSMGNRHPKDVFRVYRKNRSGIHYAMKKIAKSDLGLNHGVDTVFEASKHLDLSQFQSPFIVPIKFAFQATESLYLVCPFIYGGQLWDILFKQQRFDMNSSRLYISEILCALEYLHEFGIICGDLKPRNIHLDYSGHVAICDFGLSKWNPKECLKEPYAYADLPYLAPEIRFGQMCTEVVDWWTLGIFLAELLSGLSASWYDKDVNGKIEAFYFVDSKTVPAVAQDIAIKLFNRNPQERLGAKGIEEIKNHPFFDGIDWIKVLKKGYEPRFKPNNAYIESPGCTFENPPSAPADFGRMDQRLQLEKRAILNYREQTRLSKAIDNSE